MSKLKVIATSLMLCIVIIVTTTACVPKENLWVGTSDTPHVVTEREYNTDYELQEPTAGDFKVAKYFYKNMVLQRDKNIVVWGTANESENGKVICAEFKGVKGSGIVENGNWEIVMKGTFSASCELGHTLKVYSAEKTVEFTDVLVGDIWVLSGQSNAVIRFSENQAFMKEYKEFIQGITSEETFRVLYQDPNDMALESNQSDCYTPQTDVYRRWSKPSKGLVSGYPMIGVFFAKKLTELNPEVPIGLISACMGGVPLNHLASSEALESFDSSLIYSGIKFGSFTLPQSCVYNTLINPLTKMAITGMLFFQGEADASLYNVYDDALRATINDYRDKFGTNFLFINMQLTSYGYGDPESKASVWDYVDDLRNAQSILAFDGTMENYKIVTTFDHGFQEGDPDLAHPIYKRPMGERAAEVAAACIYGTIDENDVGSPIPKTISYTNDKIKIVYNYVGSGLKLNNGDIPKGFEVYVNNEWIVADNVTINGNIVEITGVENPQGIRYANDLFYRTLENANLESGTGVPAAAFQVIF